MPIDDLIGQRRDAKATKVVRWLEAARVMNPICRRCWLRIHKDGDGRWADEIHRTSCNAPGFTRRAVDVEHLPETWPLARVRNADPSDRDRISALAGLTKPCSELTWERVVVLYGARLNPRANAPT